MENMEKQSAAARGPHQGQPILSAGEPLASAKAAMILLHGRGASAEDILQVAGELDQSGFAFLAPQASGFAWYPNSFLAPLESNEPELTSALQVIDSLLREVGGAGIPQERTMLLGFSQGACLLLEYAARHAAHYGGIVGLSGGVIGPDGTPRNYSGSLAGTPVFLGCSDVDPHIPRARVDLTAEVLGGLDGDVTERLYRNMGHTVNQDEIDFVRNLQSQVLG